jgi:hypothetical protein
MTVTKESIRAHAFGLGLQGLPSILFFKKKNRIVEDGAFERGNIVKKNLLKIRMSRTKLILEQTERGLQETKLIPILAWQGIYH